MPEHTVDWEMGEVKRGILTVLKGVNASLAREMESVHKWKQDTPPSVGDSRQGGGRLGGLHLGGLLELGRCLEWLKPRGCPAHPRNKR